MNRFNQYMNNGFSGCRLLAYARDNCRHRDVRIYQVPGFVEEVGVTDGTDSWIAPVIADPFSVNIRQIMRDLFDGKPIPAPIKPGPKSARIKLLPPEPTKAKRVVLTNL
jgi:hypothetical protein